METDGVTVREKFNGKRVYHNFTAEHAILNRAPSPLSRKDLPLAGAIGRMYLFCGCLPRTVNGTGHTGPSEFCATSI